MEWVGCLLYKRLAKGQPENLYLMRCAIWYHLYNLYNVKNTHREALLLVVKPVTSLKVTLLHECWSTFFKLYKWYQITQSITYVNISWYSINILVLNNHNSNQNTYLCYFF